MAPVRALGKQDKSAPAPPFYWREVPPLANRARDWLSEAEYDLETAVILLENRRYDAACFYAQQAAEKAVKAVLLSRNVWRTGYSVLDLLKELLRHHVGVPEELLDAARVLDKHYMPPH